MVARSPRTVTLYVHCLNCPPPLLYFPNSNIFFDAKNLLLVSVATLSFHQSPLNFRSIKAEGNFTFEVNYHYCCHSQEWNLCIYLKELWAWIAQSILRLATAWTIRGSSSGGGDIFCTRPDRPYDPPIHLCNGYQVFPGG